MIYSLQTLIEDIRTALAFSESVPPNKLERYARQYANECTKLNERLKRCLPHIREGNVAEAIRIADTAPNLAETYSLLDFENRHEWVDVCDGLGLDVPPPLSAEIFRELSDAYLQIVPLDPLLKRHRLLALNGSPLRDRLAVLRSIAQADPMNLHWQTDLETFEQARIKEIGQDVTDALSQDNMPQLQEIYRELTAPGWHIAPPREYREKICTAVLKKYADELIKHFSTFDYPHAAVVYQSMQQVLFINQMSMPDSIEKSIRAGVQWIQETANEQEILERFQRESAELQNALDEDVARQELEPLYYALQNTVGRLHGMIPIELENRYRSRIEHLSRMEKYRYGIIITIFAGSLILVGTLVGYALIERSFSEQAAHTLATLQEIRDENQIDEIEQTLKTIKPNIAESLKVAPLVAELKKILEQDKERAEEFEHYRSQAALLLEQELDMDGLKAAKSSVDQADRLKRTPQEVAIFSDLRSQYDRSFSQLQVETDRAFSVPFVQYAQEFNALPRRIDDPHSAAGMIEPLGKLAEKIEQLSAQFPDISDRQKREVSNLLSAIVSRQKLIQQSVTETEQFQQILTQIHDLPSYRRTLQQFSGDFPEHPAADDMKTLLEQFDATQSAAESLQQLCRHFSDSANRFRRSQNISSGLEDLYDSVAEKIEGIGIVFPSADAVQTLSNMKPITQATFQTTVTLLTTIAQRNVYPWIDGEDWYYLTSQPSADASGRIENAANFEFVTSMGATPKKITLVSRLWNQNKNNYSLIQSDFARKALREIDAMTVNAQGPKNPSEIFGNLLIEMNESAGIDPLLKVVVLSSFIADYSAADPIFSEQLTHVTEWLRTSNVDLATNWMDVESSSVVTNRQRAGVVLTRIGNIQTHMDQVQKKKEAFRNQLSENAMPTFEFAGIMIRQDRRWKCSLIVPTPASATGKLFVLKTSGSMLQPIQVGTVSNGQTALSDSINVLQCSPVFFVNETIEL